MPLPVDLPTTATELTFPVFTLQASDSYSTFELDFSGVSGSVDQQDFYTFLKPRVLALAEDLAGYLEQDVLVYTSQQGYLSHNENVSPPEPSSPGE